MERELYEKAVYRFIAELLPLNKKRILAELKRVVDSSSNKDKSRGYSRGFPWMVETYLEEITSTYSQSPGEFIYELTVEERWDISGIIDAMKDSPHKEELDWRKLEGFRGLLS